MLDRQRRATDRLFFAIFQDRAATVAGDIAGAIAMPRFTVAFSSATTFRGRPEPFVLRGDDGVAGLVLLQERLATAMGKAGLGCAERSSTPPCTPHVTLM